MKKVSGFYSVKIPIVKLFLEDIEELSKLLTTYFDEIEIIADDFILENVSEINNIKKDMISNLIISAYEKKICIEI